MRISRSLTSPKRLVMLLVLLMARTESSNAAVETSTKQNSIAASGDVHRSRWQPKHLAETIPRGGANANTTRKRRGWRRPKPSPQKTVTKRTRRTELVQSNTTKHRSFSSQPQPSLTVLYLASFLVFTSVSSTALSPVPALIAASGVERATTILSALSAAAACLEITASGRFGALLDRAGRKPALLATVSALTVANLGVAVCHNVPTICVAKFVGTVCIGFFFLTTQAVISDYAAAAMDRSMAGSAIAKQMSLTQAGFLIGMLSAGQMSHLGLPIIYGVAAAMGALAVLLIRVGLVETMPDRTKLVKAKADATTRRFTSPFSSCVRLLTHRGKDVRVLGILLMLMTLPAFMGDFFQVFAKSEWNLTTKHFSSFLALYSAIGIVSNMTGSVLVRKMGIKKFTFLAIVSRLITGLSTAFFGFRGCMIGMSIGFIGSAQSIGVVSALLQEAVASGLPQGELAGERASLMALLKVVGPVLYSTLYLNGQRWLGMATLPFLFNVGLSLVALVLSQMYLK